MAGTFNFSFNPDYDQNKDTVEDVLPSSNYSFEIDHADGLQITTQEIQFHFNAFLRSLGYVIDHEEKI